MNSSRFQKKVGKRSSGYRHPPGSYDYSGLAHWWVYNYGVRSTGSGRMTADGNQISSYSTVIATLFDPNRTVFNNGNNLILISNYNYSVTTAKHLSKIKEASYHLNVLYVGNPDPGGRTDHISNMRNYLFNLEELAESYLKRRADSTRERDAKSMGTLRFSAIKYGEYFKLKNIKEYNQIIKFPMPDNDNFEEKVISSAKDRMISGAKEKKRKANKAKKANEDMAKKEGEKLILWLRGEKVYVSDKYLDKIYMRVMGDYIETTGGAKIRLKDAGKAYARFTVGKLSVGMHIGEYTFGGIDEDNNAHIGCHTLPLSDIAKLLDGVKEVETEVVDPEEEIESIDSLVRELDELGGSTWS